MKVLKYALPALAIAGSTSFIAPTAQSAEVSGNVALVTDYKFRGISQSDSKPS
ncbi:MAG: TorF family putative porin, partial [Luminiphilus sp.]